MQHWTGKTGQTETELPGQGIKDKTARAGQPEEEGKGERGWEAEGYYCYYKQS
jgi:hypothetical protein